MNPPLLLRVASVVLLTAGAWIVPEASVSAQSNETAPSAAKPSLQFVDCVKICIHRMETAKAECAARETPAHNYDTNKCVMGPEDQVVNCVRACNPSTQ
jgi:hypothetical protein